MQDDEKGYVLKRHLPVEGKTQYRMHSRYGQELIGIVHFEPGYGWSSRRAGSGPGWGGYARRAGAAEALWQDWLASGNYRLIGAK